VNLVYSAFIESLCSLLSRLYITPWRYCTVIAESAPLAVPTSFYYTLVSRLPRISRNRLTLI